MKSYTMYADKLNKEYTEAFDQVVTYLSTETIDEVTKDEQLGDLFDLFLTAQTAGRPVKRITGGNMEYFCRSFVSEFGWKNRLLYFADYTKRVAWFLLVFSVLDMLIAVWDGGFSALLNPTDVTNYFGYLVGMAICALVGALVGTLTRRTMFRLKKGVHASAADRRRRSGLCGYGRPVCLHFQHRVLLPHSPVGGGSSLLRLSGYLLPPQPQAAGET